VPQGFSNKDHVLLAANLLQITHLWVISPFRFTAEELQKMAVENRQFVGGAESLSLE
jgi:hypothetical protein